MVKAKQIDTGRWRDEYRKRIIRVQETEIRLTESKRKLVPEMK